jgi:tRNA pseudouridine13 synthase
MTIGLRESHPTEQKMGIRFYATQKEGVGGRIRLKPSDFIVEEILPDKRIVEIDNENFSFGPSEPGLVTEFVLIKKNVESHFALMKITEALDRDIDDIKISGTKDKQAYTAQRATIWRVPPEQLMKLDLKGITIRAPRTTIYQTYLGNLYGNHFNIKIGMIKGEHNQLKDQFKNIHQEIIDYKGVPNFFGHQRFGTRRPISHLVGKELILGNIKKAIRIYLTRIFEDETDILKKARKTLQETNDPKEAIDLFPKSMAFERRILQHLINNPNDYHGALRIFPYNLMKLFVHAYQSYIWNQTLSERMTWYEDLGKHKEDIIVNERVVIPIIGYRSRTPDSKISDYAEELLKKDGIKKSYFKCKEIPNLRVGGTYREIAISPNGFSYLFNNSKENDDFSAKVIFSLSSGSYATVVLIEYMKSSPIHF